MNGIKTPASSQLALANSSSCLGQKRSDCLQLAEEHLQHGMIDFLEALFTHGGRGFYLKIDPKFPAVR